MSDKTSAQQEADLAARYLDTATLGREVANLALQQALAEAKAQKLRDPAKTATAAITASAIALDKRLLLQERPTQIVATDPSLALNALARKLGLSQATDSTATEIPNAEPATPNTNDLPLLPESVDGKARASE